MKKSILIGLMLSATTLIYSQGTWSSKASITGARYGAFGFAIGTKCFIGGGETGSGYKNDFWEYNPATNVWTQKANYASTTTARSRGEGFSIGSKGYTTGGKSSGTTVYNALLEYDTLTNIWSTKASYPGLGRYCMASFSIGTKAYVGTGMDASGNLRGDFYEYNQSTNTWTQKASYAGGVRWYATGFSIGTKGYFGTGDNGNNLTTDFYEYNPTSDAWTQKTNFAGSARFWGVGFGLSGYGFLGCGEDASYTALGDFYRYDPTANTWSSIAPYGGVYGAVAFSNGNKGYVGCGASGGTALNSFGEYDLCGGLLAPTGTASQIFCNNATVANLSATGTAIQWYAASSGGSALATSSALVNGTHYFATQTVGSCESTTRFDVTATINVSPTPAPTGTASQTICNNATVANLSATGTSILWYAASSGGSALSTTTALINGTHYFASQTVSSCESATRFEVTATINAPATPTGTASQIFCNSATVANLSATGTAIQWYAAPSGGSPLATSTALVSGTHYFSSQTVGSCESATRFDVTVTINVTATPTGTQSQTFCNIATIADLSATGTAIQWYAAYTGGLVLPPTTALVNSTTYFATQTISACESATRLYVTATINVTPAPTGSPSQTICNSGTVANLLPWNTSIKWYVASSGGSALATTTALVNATHYFASQTISGCESTTRFDVNLTINAPATPTGPPLQTFCNSATVADLSATGTAIQWYASSSGGLALTTTMALVNGTHYFATQTISGCKSVTRLDVTATINPTPTVTANTTASTLCNGSSITLTGGGASTYVWSGGVTDGVAFTPSGTTTYTVTGTDVYSCTATATKTITVNSLPDITTNLIGVTITANQNGAVYQWLDCNNGNVPIAGQNNQSFTATVNGNYSVIVTQNSCFDTSSCNNITTTGINENSFTEAINIYPNPFTSQTIITFSQEQKYVTIKIMDMLGKEIKSINFKGRQLIIEKGEMNAGTYLVRIKTEQGLVTKKVIICK